MRNRTLIVIASICCSYGTASWIDPDTPKSAYTTRRRSMPPPPPVVKTQTHETEHSSPTMKPTIHKKVHRPSAHPSESPSASPTKGPTLSPTKEDNLETPGFYHLVMSDEFNVPNRRFDDGYDPKWTALNKNDYTNGALHYYSPDNIITKDGDLQIRTEAETTIFAGFNDTAGKDMISKKNFKSGMLQSWNKFCFTGGIVEAEIQLPGKHDVAGLWPAFWLLGNIARHTYVGSTAHVWPWSSNVCTEKSRSAQRINGCMVAQHFGLQPGFGRGAPEIDIFEVQAGPIKRNTEQFLESPVGQPFASTSFQVAPGRFKNRPGGGFWPGPGQWYEGLTGGVNTSLNIQFYGDYNHFRGDSDDKDYWSDAVSFNHQLDESFFEKKMTYRVEWELPNNVTQTDGYIRWFINDRFVFDINGTGIIEAGNGATISTEPMYIILNTAVSKEWGFPAKCPSNCVCDVYDCNSSKFQETCGFSPGFCNMMTNKTDTPTYKVNWVRVYQNPNDLNQKVGCSTPERPTRTYIEAHEHLYKTVDDAHPLKPVANGGGRCTVDNTVISDFSPCGGVKRGVCTENRVCVCRPGWTGPYCLASDGYDPIDYERRDGFADIEFTGPDWRSSAIWTSLLILCCGITIAPTLRRRMDGWRPIPEADTIGPSIVRALDE